MEIHDKKFLVIGTGVSGIAACTLLKKHKCQVILVDGNKELNVEALKEKAPEIKDVKVILGDIPEDCVEAGDIAVLSPGVPTDLPMVQRLRDKKVIIWGEIELAYQFGRGRIAAITGTNGKTTTTSLLGEIFAAYFPHTLVVGNIGIPYTQVVDETTKDTVIAAEISSFQLETIQSFAPQVSAILNITPDHLNRHHTMDNYIAAKESITRNQKPEDTCVLNYEDKVLRDFGKTLSCQVVYFSSQQVLEEGLYYENQSIYWARNGETKKIIAVDELNILGAHNYENVMAAVAMADHMGVPMDIICQVLRTFQAVEHRIEYVCEKHGVRFYNDSKGTNPDAAIKGILAMNRRTCLIGGGYDKESTYDEWIESFGDKVKLLVLIGQTREKIAACAKRHGFCNYVFADSLEQAIDICYEKAEEGEAVLLSPACASWGMFPNYEERGRIFKEYVRNLKE